MISVIIPCFNSEETVDRAVKSVIEQSYKDWELILIDNNSSDKTLEKLLSLQDFLQDRVVIGKESIKGANAARNAGLSLAKGDWVQFLDADDVLDRNKMERQLEIGEKEHADVVCGSYLTIQPEENSKILFLRKIQSMFKNDLRIKDTNILRNRNVTKSKDTWRGLVSAELGITSANLWRRESVEEVKGWDQDLSSSQEYDLMFRLLCQKKRFSFDYSLSAYIYKGSNTVSSSTNSVRVLQIMHNSIRLRRRIEEYLKVNNNLAPSLKAFIDRWLADYLVKYKGIISDDAFTEIGSEYLINIPKIEIAKKDLVILTKKILKK